MTIKAYNTIHEATMEWHPDDDIYSYYHVKQAIAKLSGIDLITTDMCINTCLAFTGPYAKIDHCPQFGPQLQALWCHLDHTEKMHWHEQCTWEIFEDLGMMEGISSVYEDVLHGKEYLDACQSGKIKEGDPVLMFSIDGAQLYESKQLDCWVYIWVLFNHSPDQRYQKHPKKPKNLDSFIFPGLHHLCAIQAEGLPIWDGTLNRLFISNPFLFIATADGPGMAFLTGLVSHHGKMGCRLYCGLPGQHKLVGNYDHPYILIHQLPSVRSFNYEENLHCIVCCRNAAEYESACLDTGITKPSIFCSFHSDHILPVPHSFDSDIMHIAAINAGDLLIPLWRGTFRANPMDDKATWAWAVLIKETWKKHGLSIADATLYLPGSFDHPPWNPAEKIHSGYKAWEWLLYLYGMGPATLYGVLPDPYWTNFCHLTRGLHLMQQYHISHSELLDGHQHLLDFTNEFEEIYYQRHCKDYNLARVIVNYHLD
ncbi:hypothetical protein BDR04DRAFT_1127042 [Suillus decipiens]|nr:hypothetical protein BDR04DRAFT_1127042 [Suillus decipiens]